MSEIGRKEALEMVEKILAAGHSGSLEDVKNKLETQPSKWDRWAPMPDDRYFYFYLESGEVGSFIYQDDSTDKFMIGTGNCYQNKQDAETALKIINRIIELRKEGIPRRRQQLAYIAFSPELSQWKIVFDPALLILGQIYLPTIRAAQTLIDEFGDDLFLVYGRI